MKQRLIDAYYYGDNPFCFCHRIGLFDFHTCKFHKVTRFPFKRRLIHYWKYLTSSAYRSQLAAECELAEMLSSAITEEINKEIIRQIYGTKTEQEP